jgi:hypothetical protein
MRYGCASVRTAPIPFERGEATTKGVARMLHWRLFVDAAIAAAALS